MREAISQPGSQGRAKSEAWRTMYEVVMMVLHYHSAGCQWALNLLMVKEHWYRLVVFDAEGSHLCRLGLGPYPFGSGR